MIRVFTPYFVDPENTNAQHLTIRELVSRFDPEEFEVTMIIKNIACPRLQSRKNTNFINWYSHGNTLYQLNLLYRYRPDIYFYPTYGYREVMALWMRRRRMLDMAIVTHVVAEVDNTVMTGNDLHCKVFRQVINQSDAIFANSQYVAESVHRHFHRHCGVIYNGIRRECFFPALHRRNDNNLPVVLYVGSLQPRKRVEVVIELAAKRPNVSFKIIGDGPMRAHCQTLASIMGAKNIKFISHLSQHDLGEAMQNADIFLFPSIHEGHPQVLGQAAACGLPIIAMNYYRPEYVQDQYNGYLAANDEELAQGLDKLIADSRLRYEMGQKGVEIARRFDWDQAAAAWQEAIVTAVNLRKV